MKIPLILFCCFIAMAKMAAAQAVRPDSAATVDTGKPPSRSERVQQMNARRAAMMLPAPPYKGEAAKAARRDGRRFTLPKNLLPKLHAGDINASSDYFKPTAATAGKDTLLTDSGYVKTYRYYAFNAAQHQIMNPAGTRLLIGGTVLVFISLTVALIIALSHSKG